MKLQFQEKRKRIIQALTDKSLTWNELLQETKLPKATLHRHLNRLISENIIHKTPVLYSLPGRIEIVRPSESAVVMLVKGLKRVKSGKTKLIPIVATEGKAGKRKQTD
jgi:predicted transcriptional regulator